MGKTEPVVRTKIGLHSSLGLPRQRLLGFLDPYNVFFILQDAFIASWALQRFILCRFDVLALSAALVKTSLHSKCRARCRRCSLNDKEVRALPTKCLAHSMGKVDRPTKLQNIIKKSRETYFTAKLAAQQRVGCSGNASKPKSWAQQPMEFLLQLFPIIFWGKRCTNPTSMKIQVPTLRGRCFSVF